jgi:hypothetical protein
MKTDALFLFYSSIFILSRSVLLRMRRVSDKICKENQNTHFMFSNFFRKYCPLGDNVEKYCTGGQATDDIRRMRIACWLPKPTNTHSEYAIIIAFPLQQWMHDSASVLRYTYSTLSGLSCSVVVTRISRPNTTTGSF